MNNFLCSSITYSGHKCISMMVCMNLMQIVPQHPFPTLIYCALHHYLVSATGGFQIFSFYSTLCIVLNNRDFHLRVKLTGCTILPHTEYIWNIISLLFSFFLNKNGKYHKHPQDLFKAKEL